MSSERDAQSERFLLLCSKLSFWIQSKWNKKEKCKRRTIEFVYGSFLHLLHVLLSFSDFKSQSKGKKKDFFYFVSISCFVSFVIVYLFCVLATGPFKPSQIGWIYFSKLLLFLLFYSFSVLFIQFEFFLFRFNFKTQKKLE